MSNTLIKETQAAIEQLMRWCAAKNKEPALPLEERAFVMDIEMVYTEAAKHMQPNVPAGWKLVPLIPTKDMIEASCKGPGMTMINNILSAYQIRAGLIDEKAIKFRDDGKPAIQEAYEAMLAVAPEPKEKP